MIYYLSQAVVKSRKPHICYGCNHTFPKHSILLRFTAVYDGELSTTTLCQDCHLKSYNWTMHEWEDCYQGDIGYWKDGKWNPYNT